MSSQSRLPSRIQFSTMATSRNRLGRTGDYRYIDSDQCMEQAFSLAEEISRYLQS